MTYTLDANVLVALYNPDHVHHRATVAVLDQATPDARNRVGNDVIGYMHAVNVAEVLFGYPEAQRAQVFENAFGLDSAVGLEVVDIPTDEEPFILAHYRVPGRVRMTPDACAVAAAAWTNTTLVTYDSRLASAAREQGRRVIDQHDAAKLLEH